MALTINAAQAATDEAILKLKVACHSLEKHLSAPDITEQDNTVVAKAPYIRPGQRKSSVVECASCAYEIQLLPVGDHGGHGFPHEPGGDDAEGAEADSNAHQPGGPRGRKKRQPNEDVLRECVKVMEDKMDRLIQAITVLYSVADKDTIFPYKDHMLRWATLCEGLKKRARAMIVMIKTVRQEEADRQFAPQTTVKNQAAAKAPDIQ